MLYPDEYFLSKYQVRLSFNDFILLISFVIISLSKNKYNINIHAKLNLHRVTYTFPYISSRNVAANLKLLSFT